MGNARIPLQDMDEVSLTFFFTDNDEDTIAEALLKLRKTASPERWDTVWSTFEKVAKATPRKVSGVEMKIRPREK
ncbi:hypothetical protein KSF_098950 [Reticulibacter mediterranei]|uniref:Uncharacterized protein n=1 Tax=Reticulibacter mediterranei TaxID=2778369 RepID=A0A8J3N612_9CHLR|nr:hypothetical protein [Reticulibacter mediterranei]GHO99847.1 hypothetical protein KSF_098950 [Reticulibacter mediterranei]